MPELVQIEIHKSDFEFLQSVATPFVDTPASVVRRILEEWQSRPSPAKTPSAGDDEKLPMMFLDTPPMTHTKLLGGQIEGVQPEKINWDGLLRLALSLGLKKSSGFEELRRASGANITQQKKTDDGYKYVDDLGLSYQGVSADDAMKIIVRLAKYFNFQWRIEFEWRNKPDAFRPGERATLGMAFGMMTGDTVIEKGQEPL